MGRFGRKLAVAVAVLGMLASATGCVVVRGSSSRGEDDPFRGGLGRDRATPSTEQVDRTVRTALDDVERFWRDAYPTLAGGQAFRPVGQRIPYSRAKLPPPCGQEEPTYSPNAFYCPAGDFVAWDEQTLIPQLYADYGPFLVSVVMAHEYGHAIQARLGGTRQPTIVLEQQADCFAGAWAKDVDAGRSEAFDGVGAAQLDSTVAGLLFVRDQPGSSAQSPSAHGNAFDRIRAFQEGYEQGTPRCAQYRADTIPVTEVPFTNPNDEASGGDLPYDQAVQLLSADLQEFWRQTLPRLRPGATWEPVRVVPYDPAEAPACDGDARDRDEATGAAYACPAGDFVAFDDVGLGEGLYRQVGDNAVGTLLADLFARVARDRLGRPTQGRDAQLQVDCLAGAWTSSLLSGERPQALTLSPGDLDEAVSALLVLGRSGDSDDAGAFDRIGAYRNGALQGLTSCDT